MIKNSYWSNYSRPTCYPSKCTCEAYQDGWVIQPSATITSIPFLILGLWIMGKTRKQDLRLFIFGITIYIIAIASLLAHGTFTSWAFYFDFFSIILCTSYLLLYFTDMKFNVWWIVKWLTLSFLIFPIIYYFESIRVLTCIVYFFLVFILWIKWYYNYLHRGYWFSLAYTSFFFSIIFFYLDESKLWCFNPDSWIQGHSIWHLGATVALWAMYKGLCNSHNTYQWKSLHD